MKYLFFAIVIAFFGCCLYLFVLCGADKYAAKRQWRRVPERRLLTLALLGGGPGLWCGMLCFRHKTRHGQFWAAAIAGTVWQLLALCWLFLKMLPSF